MIYTLVLLSAIGQCSGGSCRSGGCGVGFSGRSYVSGGCASGNCGPRYSSGGCASGNCSPYYSSQPSFSYYSTPAPVYRSASPIVVAQSLNLEIVGVPGGEQTRTYVKAKIQDKFYNVPVINGYMPTVTRHDENSLTLDYSKNIIYRTSMSKNGYVSYGSGSTSTNYDSGVAQAATNNRGVGALKHPDLLDRGESVPSQQKVDLKQPPLPSPSRPNDQEIENLLKNGEGVKASKSFTEEVDDLLRRPSTVGNTDNIFPRY